MPQVRLHRWPLTWQDAVDAGVTQRSIGRSLKIAQYAIQLGAEALYGAPTLMIEEVGAKLHRDTVKLLKGMG
jgi:hypothetical protein